LEEGSLGSSSSAWTESDTERNEVGQRPDYRHLVNVGWPCRLPCFREGRIFARSMKPVEMTEKYLVVFRDTGEQVCLARDLATGRFFCPVCGYPGSSEPAYEHDGLSSQNICDGCGFQYGFDDQPRPSFTTHQKCWEDWRTNWLEEERHADWCYQQLKTIGIDLPPPPKNEPPENCTP